MPVGPGSGHQHCGAAGQQAAKQSSSAMKPALFFPSSSLPFLLFHTFFLSLHFGIVGARLESIASAKFVGTRLDSIDTLSLPGLPRSGHRSSNCSSQSAAKFNWTIARFHQVDEVYSCEQGLFGKRFQCAKSKDGKRIAALRWESQWHRLCITQSCRLGCP